MGEATKSRRTKGGIVTRRINELHGALKNEISRYEIMEKVNKLKDAMESLGEAQDAVINLIQDDNEKNKKIEETDNWYYSYDDRENNIMKKALNSEMGSDDTKNATPNIRIQTLQVPKFDNSPTSYFKWKLTFERHMKQFAEETKYNYDHLTSCNKYKDQIPASSTLLRDTYKVQITTLRHRYKGQMFASNILLCNVRCANYLVNITLQYKKL